MAVLISGVAGAFVLLTLLSLTAGVAIGVVLGKRVQKRKVELPKTMQLSSSSVETGEMAEEVYDTVDHIYDIVGEQSSIDSVAIRYQKVDVENHNYSNVYTQRTVGTYQELDLQGREEHHYQGVS